MPDLDLRPITARYSKALDAKKGKGPMDDNGIAAITDSVCDIPELLAEVERLRAIHPALAGLDALAPAEALAELREALDEMTEEVRNYAARGRSSMPIDLVAAATLVTFGELLYAEAKGRADV